MPHTRRESGVDLMPGERERTKALRRAGALAGMSGGIEPQAAMPALRSATPETLWERCGLPHSLHRKSRAHWRI
jgi:hypothetical protein